MKTTALFSVRFSLPPVTLVTTVLPPVVCEKYHASKSRLKFLRKTRVSVCPHVRNRSSLLTQFSVCTYICTDASVQTDCCRPALLAHWRQ